MKLKYLLPLAITTLVGCSSHRSLVPDTVSATPDYFSTWNIQGYVVNYDGPATQKVMTEQYMFGKDSLEDWIHFFPRFRKDLIFVMDDSWDVGLTANDHNANDMGGGRLDNTRFPSFTGTPAERLGKLAKATKQAGWKGLGCWLCAQEAQGAEDLKNPDEYWRKRLLESEQAGVSYWKVDFGQQKNNQAWRQRMSDIGHDVAPGVVIEHAYTKPVIEGTDAFRTYDVEVITSVPVTIQRVASLLPYKRRGNAAGLICCEDEPYIAAGLGCFIGVMRHPLNGPLPNGLTDHVFPRTGRDLKSRMDEVERLLHWHRIAPAFGVNDDAEIDEHQLKDWWVLQERETWVGSRHVGDTIVERAPARISRNLPLPQVECNGEPPYVMSSLYPNGAIAITAIERVLNHSWYTPLATVSLQIPDWEHPIGIFGEYKELVLMCNQPISAKLRILAQDLKGEKPEDITSQVAVRDRQITIPGSVIQKVGLSAQTPGDKSAPGLVLCFK